MGKGSQVLVLWTRESACGIEPLNHVPESARFVNAVTPVRFSGDKKFYPARIIMISGDAASLEAKADELSAELAAEKENRKQEAGSKKRSRKGKTVDHTLASERDIAVALGQRAPVPPELASAKEATLRSKKVASVQHSKGQALLDNQTLHNVRRSLFIPPTTAVDVEEMDSTVESESECDDPHLGSNEDAPNCESAWCSCSVCKVLSNYCDPKCISFLRELQCLLEHRGKAEGTKYLELLPIPDAVKKVELSSSAKVNVFISSTDKDMIRMDFKNKPSALIRETLFALYGKDVFTTHVVTGRGNKPGTYGIGDGVLKALYGFVNHNVDIEKRVKMHQIVQTINRRASEWRRNLMVTPKRVKRNKQVEVVSSPSHSEMMNLHSPHPQRTSSLPQSPQVPRAMSSLADFAPATPVPAGGASTSTSTPPPSSSTADNSMAHPGSRGQAPHWPSSGHVAMPHYPSWPGPWPQQYANYHEYPQHYGCVTDDGLTSL